MSNATTGGSTKQREWANQIAGKWLALFDEAIARNDARPESDGVRWYSDAIRFVRAAFVSDLESLSASQIIDLRNSAKAEQFLTMLANSTTEKKRDFASNYAG